MLRSRCTHKRDLKVVFFAYVQVLYRHIPIVAFISVVCAILFTIFFTLSNPSYNISISSTSTLGQHISEEEIRTILLEYDISQAQQRIHALESVKNVHIQRKWNTIYVDIIPNSPVYSYYEAGAFVGYINEYGQLYVAWEHEEYATLVRIITPRTQIKESFDKLKHYEHILSKTHKIDMHSYISTPVEQLVLTNGARIILGNTQGQGMLRLQKMMEVVGIIKFRENSIVDLRYKNGFAKTN